MTLREICRELINIGEASERLAPHMLKNRDNAALHSAGTRLLDMSIGMQHAFKALSPAMIGYIKNN
jgi:hypothetical protein